MAFFPSSQFFDATTEAEFRKALIQRATPATEASFLVIAGMLCTFFVLDLADWQPDYLWANVARGANILVLIGTVIANRTIGQRQSRWVWIIGSYLIAIVFFAVFYFSGKGFGSLSEGGPMLVVMGMTMMPMLDLKEKLGFWALLGAFIFYLHIARPFVVDWVFFYYLFAVFLAVALQYQIDRLMRMQYRAELIEAEKAQIDELTGAFNRKGLEAYLNDAIAELKPGDYLHVAMLDIDFFKRYNDHYGHLEGDRVLSRVARALVELGTERVVRFGGEEFILVDRTQHSRPSWLEEINSAILQLAIPHERSEAIDWVSISGGVITLSAQSVHTPKELLSRADDRLYQAKHEGRNRVCYGGVL